MADEEFAHDRAGVERVEKSRLLERYRAQVSAGGLGDAEFELENQTMGGRANADVAAAARAAVASAKEADSALREYVTQLAAAMITRDMDVRPVGDGPDPLYDAALERAQRSGWTSGNG